MPISATTVAPRHALGALAAALGRFKAADRLAPVTVAVPTNTCGVMTRRALGRAGGIAGVDMVTLNRLAELIAGPVLAEAGRSPVSTPIIDLTIASVLAADPGPFETVATHPSTIVALRDLHNELRLTGPERRDLLAQQSRRGRAATRVSVAVDQALQTSWYDEADLFSRAASEVTVRRPDRIGALVVYLPQGLPGLALAFVRALGEVIDVEVVAQLTGEADADADTYAMLAELGVDAVDAGHDSSDPTTSPGSVALVTTTDADEEAREAARLVVAAARDGVAFERIAVLWPTQQPYARLVEHHLALSGIPWNGRSGTTLAERLAPRLVLDLLDVDRRGLRRRQLFDLLADIPVRGHDGEYLPTASWERVSRAAGVARDDDWTPRLASIASSGRWAPEANALREFVAELREELGHPATTRTWASWASWCTAQVEQRLGRQTIERLPEPEYRAYEALTSALDRLGHLDPVSVPVTRHRFRSTLEAELDAMPSREGRVGDGVTIGPLGGAVGLDVDVAIVLGAAEGLLPPTPRGDPLLSDADRSIAGLPTADARANRLHHLLLALITTSAVTFTAPRGDLRTTARLERSRWLAPWLSDVRDVSSHHGGLTATAFPANEHEHRLRQRTQITANGNDLAHEHSDPVLSRSLALSQARRRDDFTSFDGNLAGVAALPVISTAVSPSQLEAWPACPHAYFAQYVLEVAPIEEPGDEISITARDRGSAHHGALDLFHRAVVDGTLPQPGPTGWSPAHRDALVSCFETVCAQTERRGRTGRPAFWADERARMLADLLGWLDHDSEFVASRGSIVLASEMRFGTDDDVAITLGDGRRIALKGTVDRVDRTRDGTLVVTDHKSGGKQKFKDLSAQDPTMSGTLFQLPSYAAAARARFGSPDTPVRAEYGLLRKGDYERPGYTLDADVDERVRNSLARVVHGIESGVFPHLPERPGWRFYVSCEYCEPDHLGTAERWADWERKRHDAQLSAWFAVPEIES